MVQTLGRSAGAAGARRRRPRPQPKRRAEPPEVPITRLTVIRAQPSDAARPRRAELERTAGDPTRPRRRRRRAAGGQPRCCAPTGSPASDPYGHEVGRAARLAVRVGYGTGEELADGPLERGGRGPASRSARRRRAEALRPQERLAAVLGGREPIDVCETLLLRARADLDQGRPREAALQLRLGLEALLAELPDRRAGPGGGPRHASGAPRGVDRAADEALRGRAVGRARRAGGRDARHLRARPAPPPDPLGAELSSRRRATACSSSATSPSSRTAASAS